MEYEGYTSWITDYGVFAKYSNSLLTPNSESKVHFIGKDKKRVKGFSLDLRKFIAENGKTKE